MSAIELSSHLAALLAKVGLGDEIRDIKPLVNGGNNKTWFVEAGSGRYVAKQYFRHAEDSRDRLNAEFEFTRYAFSLVPNRVPTPIVADRTAGLAIFGFLPGNVFREGEIGIQEVSAAATFFKAINGPERMEQAKHLPDASESCFSIVAHLSLVRGRIERLRKTVTEASDAQAFIDSLWAGWQILERDVLARAEAYGINPNADLSLEQRCVSPSDFGFHNALRDENGMVRFLDFEYAGWDDPAKMVGDFFAQLAVPAPGEYFNDFIQIALSGFPDSSSLFKRAQLLRPVYQIKWCCIALNVLLPVNLARRKFANPSLDERALKQSQLAKAATLFQSTRDLNYGLH
ncbi:MAG: Phosphotransferase enzyme family protein [Betaproteobacteria bacterium ADurb.Bin341]|nr:MAG: Phosphotransferase enzyme family protein [Betaproteobacteria bacterium ADurb.Bin341]